MTDKAIWKGADETSLHAASILVDLDYSVLPCCWPDAEGNCGCGWNHKNAKEIGKAPRVTGGIKEATSIPAQVSSWFTDTPQANIGLALAPAGLVMVDPDSPEALSEAEKLGLPPTLTRNSRSPAYLYTVPPGTPLVSMIHWGDSSRIDILTQGYSLVHGQHQTGCPVYLEDPYMEPAPAPQWVLNWIHDYAVKQTAQEESAGKFREESAGGPPVNLEGQALEWWCGELVVDGADHEVKPLAEASSIDTSDTLFRIGLVLADANASKQSIADSLAERDVALGYKKYSGRKKDREYWRIAEKVGTPANGNTYPDVEQNNDSHGLKTSVPSHYLEVRDWPNPLAEEAFYGLAGEIVRAIEPHTEADPAALLINFLVYYGNAVGRSPHAVAEAARHGTNLNAVLVGETSKARKDSSQKHIGELFNKVDSTWSDSRIMGGLSSGEGLIWNVRDPIEKKEAIKDKNLYTGDYQTFITDHGVDDKRLLVVESEFASVLKVMTRDGNTLSALIRQAWDSGNLRTMTKNNPAVASEAHISILGHVTKMELLRYLNDVEAGNGFANRFIWFCTKRSNVLPDGGGTPEYDQLVPALEASLKAATNLDLLARNSEAREMWHEIYEELSAGKPGLLGSITARAEAIVLRLSVLYATIDGSVSIKSPHLEAAIAVWEYAAASASYIFGDATGDPIADRILTSLSFGEVTRTQASSLFGRHISGDRIDQALNLLLTAGKVSCERQMTRGRPVEVWMLAR